MLVYALVATVCLNFVLHSLVCFKKLSYQPITLSGIKSATVIALAHWPVSLFKGWLPRFVSATAGGLTA